MAKYSLRAAACTAGFSCLVISGCGGGSASGSSGNASIQPAADNANTPAALSPAADATQARFFAPRGIALAANGDLYVADTGNRAIRKLAATGDVTTDTSTPGLQGSADGIGAAALFTDPRSLTLDALGSLYVTDCTAIRKITSSRLVTTIAGRQGIFGSVDGIGTAALFREPDGIAVDGAGGRGGAGAAGAGGRRIAANGIVTTLAGLDLFSPGTQ